MKQRLILLLLTLCWFASTPFSSGRSAPNILFIAVDDLNDWTHPLAGHPHAITPNMDRLASSGTVFTNAHCQAPLCGPSRASVFTGLYPSTSGIYVHVKDDQITSSNSATRHAVFLTHYFEQHGYKTMGAGKLLHEGAGAHLLQEFAGFNSFGPHPPRKFRYDAKGTATDWGAYPARDEEMPDFNVAEYAVHKLQAKHDQPFFLALGFNRPHVPWYVPQTWFDLFDVEAMETPPYLENDLQDIPPLAQAIYEMEPTPKTEWLIERGYWQEVVEAYLACVAFVDAQIGRVLDALHESAYADNTIIVLWSDHGYHLGEKNIVAKMTLYEESTRVPLILAGPGINRNARTGRPVGLIDLYPTLVALAGLPPRKDLDGRSLVPLLKDPTTEWGHPSLTFWGQGNTAVRTERYRYIRYEDGTDELYDREVDPNEWHNVAMNPEYADLKERLAGQIPGSQAVMSAVNSFTWNDYWKAKTHAAQQGTFVP